MKARIKLWLPGGVLVSAGATIATLFTSPVQGAPPPKFGSQKSVKVIGVRFNDIPTPRKATVQEWVDQFNREVSSWYQRVSDNRESYRFELAPLRAGAQRSPGDWISLPYPSTVGFYVDTLNQLVMPTIDSVIDFSAIDHLVIVSAGPGSRFGQSSRSTSPDDAILGSWPLRVSQGGELDMEDKPGTFNPYRRIAVALLNEYNETDSNFIQETSAILIHEFGHLHGFPDRYDTFNMNGSGRDYVTGYSPMGLQWEAQVNALSVHFLAFEQHWVGFAQNAAPLWEIPKNTIAQEFEMVTLATTNPRAGSRSMLKIPVEGSGQTYSNFRGYTVEARTRDTTSMFNDHVLQPGVVVTWVDPTTQSEWHHLKVVDDPNNPADLWNAAFEVGDHFEDGGRGVVIDVLQNLTNGYRVRVTNVNPTAMRPDPRITPWTTDTWESVDIWIDSPVNGYGTFTSPDGNRDVPAVRSTASDAAIVNRVYYRISNDGLSTAQNPTVNVSYAAPGIGMTPWTLIGSKPIGAILPGQSVTGYADWQVPDGFANGEPHACVKVEIVADSSDLNTSNNLTQENIFEIETVRSSPWKPCGRTFTVTNPSKVYDARVLLHISGLPIGWAVRLWPSGFPLAPRQSQVVKFMLYPAGRPGAPEPDYSAGYLARVKVTAQFDMLTHGQYRTETGGGINAWVRLTEGTKTSLSIPKGRPGGVDLRICVKRLTGEKVSGARVGVQYWKGATVKWASGITAADGCVTTRIDKLSSGKWRAKCFYSSAGRFGSSRSPTLAFVIR